MEVQGAEALFRSLVVAPAYRGLGLACCQQETLVESARGTGLERTYLPTNTIALMAETWGYRRIDRAQVPSAIQETSEFRGAHCASVVPM